MTVYFLSSTQGFEPFVEPLPPEFKSVDQAIKSGLDSRFSRETLFDSLDKANEKLEEKILISSRLNSSHHIRAMSAKRKRDTIGNDILRTVELVVRYQVSQLPDKDRARAIVEQEAKSLGVLPDELLKVWAEDFLGFAESLSLINAQAVEAEGQALSSLSAAEAHAVSAGFASK